MNKYIDTDLLKKEIERQKSLFSTEKGKEGLSKTDKLSLGARIATLEETVVLIDSLQQEQPEIDLEKEIERVVEYYNNMVNGSRVMKPSGVEKIARHFYELGLNTRKEENK